MTSPLHPYNTIERARRWYHDNAGIEGEGATGRRHLGWVLEVLYELKARLDAAETMNRLKTASSAQGASEPRSEDCRTRSLPESWFQQARDADANWLVVESLYRAARPLSTASNPGSGTPPETETPSEETAEPPKPHPP